VHPPQQVLAGYLTELANTQDLDGWFARLFQFCEQTKESAGEGWSDVVRRCRLHPLFEVIQECPYHRRAFEKPRGYPGDAGLLDMIYDLEGGIEEADRATVTDRGLRLFHAYQRRDSCESVRERKHVLAKHIHQVADSKLSARILAVACGHLREAAEVERKVWGRVQELVAFDQDAQSLAVVSDACAHLPVKTMEGRVQDIIKGSILLSQFDLVYSAGLFDYLNDRAAVALIQRIASGLNEGGEALIGNFQYRPEMPYAEIFQDWKLVTRAEQELIDLASRSLGSSEFKCRAWSDKWNSIAWLQITRPAA
jgi:extracellular factor (EF) 3-hydroxypalmitic acid methyl ester biosynthesis protein